MTYRSPLAFSSPFESFLERWWYEPVTIWAETFRSFFNPQFIINNTEDLEVEREILRQVGSYGKQLGLQAKVIDILLRRLHDELTDDEKVVLEEYRELQSQIKHVLQEYRGPRPTDISIGYLQRLNASLEDLRQQRPDEYRRAMRMLAAIVEQNGAGIYGAGSERPALPAGNERS